VKKATETRVPPKPAHFEKLWVPLPPSKPPVYRPGAWDFRKHPSLMGKRKE
jgi:hypothetical protein